MHIKSSFSLLMDFVFFFFLFLNQEQKSLITLDEMLDAYISLKEHKIMMDQEKFMLAQEKNQVQNLLQGLHDVMTTYNASGNIPSTSAKFALALVPQSVVSNKSQPGTILHPQSSFIYAVPMIE